MENYKEILEIVDNDILQNRKFCQNLISLMSVKNNYFNIETLDGYYVEVHHIIPNSEGVDEEGSLDRPGNMIVVCPNHHRYLHWNKGGNYKLQKENDCLYLANDSDKLAIITDLHLSKYNNL